MKVQQIQRIHGTFLIILASSLAIYSVVAEMTGWGVYGFLQEMPWGQVGLIQAYILMALIGLSIITGSKSAVPNKMWNVVGMTAHSAPLISLALYGYLFIEIDLANIIGVSLAIHGTWIAIELFTVAFVH